MPFYYSFYFMNKKLGARLLCFLLIYIFLFGCNRIEDNKLDYDNESVVEINIPEVTFLEEENLSNLISDFSYIPLETNENSLIGEISSLILTANEVFVHDRITKAILIFDKDGKFLNKLEALGRGPEEFSELVSFTIDTDNNHIIIGDVGKIIAFDYDGKFVYEFKTLMGGAFQIAYTGEGKLAVHTNYIQLEEDQSYNYLVVFDLEKQHIVSQSIPFDKLARVENMTSFFNNISNSSSSVKYLSIPYKSHIWQLSGMKVTPAYYVNFGSNALPEDYEKNYLSNPRYSSSQLRSVELENNWHRISGGGALLNDKFLNFSYSRNGDFTEVYFDLQTKNAYQFKVPLNNDLDGSRFVVQRATYKDKFISIAGASGLVKRANEGKISNPEVLKLVSTLEIEDNPVLRILSYKEITQ